jgi:hypothetical protein
MATKSMPGVYRRICKSHVFSSPSYSMRSYLWSKWHDQTISIPRKLQAGLAIHIQTRSNATFSDIGETLPLSNSQRNTIYALSTPPGRAGVAVIRISGPHAMSVYHAMVRRQTRTNSKGKRNTAVETASTRHPEPWKMFRCSIVHPQSRRILDEAMAVYFACRFLF